MKNDHFIQDYIRIKDNRIKLGEKVLFESDSKSFAAFAKAAYQHFNDKYPKFFKMDALSKLAFLAAEIILSNQKSVDENTALVFSNRAGSLDTDRKHQETIADANNYYPSPAVFVYTLPNICLGEISIRHKLHSENSFFIFDHFNANHLFQYSSGLLQANKTASVLCGWVEMDAENYDAFLYLVGENGALPHTTDAINEVYNNE